MTTVLTENDVREILTMRLAIEAVEESLLLQGQGKLSLHPRRRMKVPEKTLLHYMAAGDPIHDYLGMKIYVSAAGKVRFVVMLCRASTGEMLALIEADALGQIRTGAATGVATKYLANPMARTLGIIGTGYQARTQLEAVASVRSLEKVRAFGRDPARRASFCKEMTAKIGVEVQPANSAEETIRDAEIVITATSGMQVVVEGAWLLPGSHINAIGANFAQKRELDDTAVRRATLIAVDSLEQAKMEAGDLIQAYGSDETRWSSTIELSAIVAGKLQGRVAADQVTLFKSIGIATWDIAAAARVYEIAQQRGMGTQIPLWEISGHK